MIKILPLIHFLFISILIPNNINVSIFDESKYEDGYTIFGTLEGKYSAIIDKNGNILAKTVPVINIGVNPNLVIDKEKLLITLKLLFLKKFFFGEVRTSPY